MTREELVTWFDDLTGPDQDTATIFTQFTRDAETVSILATTGNVSRESSSGDIFWIGSGKFDVSALDDAQSEAIDGSSSSSGFVIPLAANVSLRVRDNADFS